MSRIAEAATEIRLGEQETALLCMLARGISTQATARGLGISVCTLRRRLRAVCTRIGVSTPIEAVVWATQRELVQP